MTDAQSMADFQAASRTRVYTREQVSAAVNKAAAWLIDQFEYEDEDAIQKQSYGDLLVNLGMGWLDNPDADPRAVIEESWSEPAGKVLSWAGLGDEDEDEDEDQDEATYARYGGESEGCTCCDVLSGYEIPGALNRECSRCGHLGKSHRGNGKES